MRFIKKLWLWYVAVVTERAAMAQCAAFSSFIACAKPITAPTGNTGTYCAWAAGQAPSTRSAPVSKRKCMCTGKQKVK